MTTVTCHWRQRTGCAGLRRGNVAACVAILVVIEVIVLDVGR